MTDDPVPALFSPAFLRNPYPTYREHRKGPRVQRLEIRPNSYAMFRYADCLEWFRDPRLTAERKPSFWVNAECSDLTVFDDLINHMQRWLLFQGPARHAVLRKAMNAGFSPSVIEELKPRIAQIVDELVRSFPENDSVDLIKDFAYPLPVYVICALLGVPDSLRPRMVALSTDFATWFGNPRRTPESSAIAQSAIRELVAHFADITRSRHEAGDDLLGLLLRAAADEAVGMSEAELHAQCVMLLIAGHETTRNLIGNGLYSLLTHPDQWEQLRQAPDLVRGAIEETLRYESPVQNISRTVTQPLDIVGVRIPTGASLMFMLGSAHRDEQQFTDPERFDIRRAHLRHVGFGGDAHVCLGSTLARLESQMAIGELVRRFATIELRNSEPQWSPVFTLRGLKELRVTCAR